MIIQARRASECVHLVMREMHALAGASGLYCLRSEAMPQTFWMMECGDMSPLWMFWFFECEVSADVRRRVNQSSAMTSHSIILMPVWAEHVRLAEGC